MKLLVLLVLLAMTTAKTSDAGDLLKEHGEKMCRMMARNLSLKQGTKPRKRCAYLADTLEEFAIEAFGDLLGKIKYHQGTTEGDLVKNAQRPATMISMKKYLRTLSKWILTEKTMPSEKDIGAEVRKTMNRWMLDVVGDDSKSSRIDLQAMRMDEDELEDEDYESESWGVY
ncbi:hypothetical protein DIPPA_14497 [Diplonema papillatum]|nr:hypothetical protein DIPPA_14497 [Diplonema papillatum]